MPTGQRIGGAAGAGPQLVLDHMNKHAFDVYAQRVGGTAYQYDGQYFGHGLRAIFVDSLEYHSQPGHHCHEAVSISVFSS
jgi:hypothetical protein